MNELVRKAQSGRASDVTALVDKLSGGVKHLARRYGQYLPQDEIGDLESEGWIYVWKRLPDVDTTIGYSLGHLYAYARYGMLCYLKRSIKQKQREPLLEDMPNATALRGFGSSKSREQDFAPYLEWKIAAHNTVAKLRPTNRLVLEMMLEGLNGNEIAEALGCTKQNVAHYRGVIQRQVSRKLFGGKYV